MILIPELGFILVDAEYKKSRSDYGNFPLDVAETVQYSSLQRNFNLPVWYALSNELLSYKTWYWIPVSKVLEENAVRTSQKTNTDFFAIPIEKFIQLSFNDNLGDLFQKFLMDPAKNK